MFVSPWIPGSLVTLAPRNDATLSVMRGLDPRIHQNFKALLRRLMDGRVKPGHDSERNPLERHCER